MIRLEDQGPEFSITSALSALDPVALGRLQSVLQDDAADQRGRIMKDLMRVAPSIGAQLLGQLVAFATWIALPA